MNLSVFALLFLVKGLKMKKYRIVFTHVSCKKFFVDVEALTLYLAIEQFKDDYYDVVRVIHSIREL